MSKAELEDVGRTTGRPSGRREARSPEATSNSDIGVAALERERDRWRVEAQRHREASQLLLLAFDEFKSAQEHIAEALKYQREAISQFVSPGNVAED